MESRLGDAELRARFPLELVSAKSDDSMNSTFGNQPGRRNQTSQCSFTTATRGAWHRTGDRVRVYNDRGSCTFDGGRGRQGAAGVVRAPSVRWNKFRRTDRNVNVLTSDRLTDIGGGPTFYSCLVEVEKCGD